MDLLQEVRIEEVPPGLLADDFVVLESSELLRDPIENENDTLHVARDDPVKGILDEVFLKVVCALEVLLGEPRTEEPLGKASGRRNPPSIDSIVDAIKKVHGLS